MINCLYFVSIDKQNLLHHLHLFLRQIDVKIKTPQKRIKQFDENNLSIKKQKLFCNGTNLFSPAFKIMFLIAKIKLKRRIKKLIVEPRGLPRRFGPFEDFCASA
ncbi:hypothetical protein BpHYR1_038115 [Brachionus plicatilis]|uniref:Uncharacterized protein n=1 Tax=Brachionus plicatilis TaxID=10195 RepID=A0A3M7PM69_BRAPC|nr:hypothetical protein BpHYR1_038115 [Brachionus plicatilis]